MTRTIGFGLYYNRSGNRTNEKVPKSENIIYGVKVYRNPYETRILCKGYRGGWGWGLESCLNATTLGDYNT